MGNRVYKYVAVIGIDGMGSFCDKTSTPNFDRIFKNGCRTTDALSMAPTISAQNWGAMLLGAK
ncbi:MAG: alkaline phosphatase family protein, partial [Clostridia bacterium]|nr:alkaline phosphatase family protein [Clostridia bacterium]